MVDCGNEAEYGRDNKWERTLKVDREVKWVFIERFEQLVFLGDESNVWRCLVFKKRYTIYYGLSAFNLL